MFDPELPHTIVCPAAAQGGASFPATVFNLVNVIMGAGYVSIPYACRQVSLDGGGVGGGGRVGSLGCPKMVEDRAQPYLP